MTVEKLTPLEEAAANAVEQALSNGQWIHMPVSHKVAEMGLDALKRRDELAKAEEAGPGEASPADVTDIDDQGWISDSWAAWRLVLRSGDNPAVVYFTRQPTYAERKAFAAAAKIPVAHAVAEERPQL